MKRYVRVIMCAVLLVCTLLMSGCYDANVNRVREGSLQSHPNVKIGAAFDKFFSDGDWNSFDATTGEKVVEFKGKGYYDGQKADYRIQFILDGDTGFHLNAVSINGRESNVLMNAILMQVIMEKAEKSSSSNGSSAYKTPTNAPDVYEPSMSYPSFEYRDNLQFHRGKKIILAYNNTPLYKYPSTNSKIVGHGECGMLLEPLGSTEDGKWQRGYIYDYGGGYVHSRHVKVMDDDAVIGKVTVNQDTYIQERAGFGPKYRLGSVSAGDKYDLLGIIDAGEHRWCAVSYKNGEIAYINKEKCSMKFRFQAAPEVKV